jgi:hypothetical protein
MFEIHAWNLFKQLAPGICLWKSTQDSYLGLIRGIHTWNSCLEIVLEIRTQVQAHANIKAMLLAERKICVFHVGHVGIFHVESGMLVVYLGCLYVRLHPSGL